MNHHRTTTNSRQQKEHMREQDWEFSVKCDTAVGISIVTHRPLSVIQRTYFVLKDKLPAFENIK